MDYVREIVRLARIPQTFEPPSPGDWKKAEADIGLTFPQDYKDLISAIGGGDFGCGLGLRNPCSSSDYVRLSREALIEHREPIADLESDLDFPLYPTAGGHVHIGGIDRQDFFLRPDGRRLEDLVWLNIDTNEFRVLDYSLPHFIHDLYLGLIAEEWADELRQYFWRNGTVPFFTARPGEGS